VNFKWLRHRRQLSQSDRDGPRSAGAVSCHRRAGGRHGSCTLALTSVGFENADRCLRRRRNFSRARPLPGAYSVQLYLAFTGFASPLGPGLTRPQAQSTAVQCDQHVRSSGSFRTTRNYIGDLGMITSADRPSSSGSVTLYDRPRMLQAPPNCDMMPHRERTSTCSTGCHRTLRSIHLVLASRRRQRSTR